MADASGSQDEPGSPRRRESSKRYVKLNIGGTLVSTTIDTLTKQGDHMLSAMFSGRMELTYDTDGWVTIDRDGRLFHYILNYLRDGTVPFPELLEDKRALLLEAKYYLLDPLVARLEADIVLSEAFRPMCAVPIVTSDAEEATFIARSRVGIPVVKFICNRANNKFSYTASSDDAMLKNIELFDKLSRKFNGRVCYIKDISGRSGHICTWFFFGHGRLLAEVCCTTMCYSAERKHTKIEFPESRLYEENMNVLLYEPKCGGRSPSDTEEEGGVAGDYLARRPTRGDASP